MVQTPGETARAGGIRSLNAPRPVHVRVTGRRPVSLREGRNWHAIASVDDVWRIADEWWRETPVARIYYRATMEDGHVITLFRDERTDRWYAVRGY